MRIGRRLTPFLLAGSAALAGVSRLSAQAIPFDIQVGYRFVDVSGNDQMYRTQINDRPGLLLRSLNYSSDGPVGGLFDYVHLDASDVGAGPAGQLRFQAGQVDLFKLTFTWRQTDLYSALPAFANPFLAQGIIPGQQTYNRTRNIYDATLELFPGKVLTPILGYTRNVLDGPGTTTYHLGGNEFRLNEQVSAVDELYRVGLGFQTGSFQGAVTQGWREYRWNDRESLQPGAGDGNVTTPVLGQDVTASQVDSAVRNHVYTPVTDVWVSGRILDRIKLIGSYVRADGNAQTSSLESDAGNFVSFEIARFFTGMDETINSRAETNFWRGSARAEITLAPNIDLAGGWAEVSRTLAGQALVTSLFLDTVTYAGVSTGNLLQLMESNTSIDRDDQVYDATVTARLLGPFAVNGGWSQTRQNVTVTPDASEIVVPEGQGGTYERTVNTYGGGVSYAKNGLMLTADYHHDEGNQPIFRTDYIHRDRYKFRGVWTCGEILRLGGVFQETHADDDIVQIGYSTTVREVAADLEVTLLKNMLTLRASGGEFLVNREILIRVPQNFDIVPTQQKELGHTWEGGVHFQWEQLTLDGGYLWMNNNGSIPFTVGRTRVLAEYFFAEHLGADFEWLQDIYDERPAFDQAGPLANYNGNRYYVGFHWRP